MQTVTVPLGERSYSIYIGHGLLEKLGDFLGQLPLTKKALVVTQPAIRAVYGDRVLGSLRARGFAAEAFEIIDAEEAKSLTWLETIYDRLIDLRLDRRSPLIALGGGVVGDLAGFAAATYLRGIPFVQIPTTLLAQVDSSIGGKTAVNHPRGKNLIGAFYQPRLVLVDVDTLQTLAPRELRSGLAEVVKYGVIANPALFQLLEEHATDVLRGDSELLIRIIRECCHIKADVVAADEQERGLRAILNFGHTFGHAIEAAGGSRRTRTAKRWPSAWYGLRNCRGASACAAPTCRSVCDSCYRRSGYPRRSRRISRAFATRCCWIKRPSEGVYASSSWKRWARSRCAAISLHRSSTSW